MKLLFSIGFLEFSLANILDILLVTILLYNLYKFIKGRVALKVFIGFLFIYLLYLVVEATEMELLSTILGQFMNVGIIAVIILFQQEIRNFLLYIGKTANFDQSKVWNLVKINLSSRKNLTNFLPVLDAIRAMSRTKTGALIVLSRNEGLKSYVDTGDILDAAISKHLLLSIFFKNSPLHDGAVIIHKNKIIAARCILPVSNNTEIPANLGLRHRAGIGITEQTDTIVLVVSEETGEMSVIREGKVFANLSLLQIKGKLNDYFFLNIVKKEVRKTTQRNIVAAMGT